jgi:outer membrane protein assembly factor BamA
VLVLSLVLAAQAGPVRQVTLKGNRALARSAFALTTRPGQPQSDSLLELDRQTILARYAEHGYFWASVAVGSADGAVTFRITEGEPARVGDISFSGNHLIASHKLRALLPHRTGRFRESDIADNARAVVAFYGDQGYPFCEVRPDSLRRDSVRVSYRLAISEGPEVRLSDVRFTPVQGGNLATRPRLLKRLLGLKLGVPYSETETRRRIARLGSDPLLTVQGFELRRSAGRYWLDVTARESRASTATGALGYSTQDRELMGQVSLAFANLFGTRRAAHFNWQRKAQRQDLSLSYTEPWLLGTPIGLTGTVQNRLRDTSFSATGFALTGAASVAEALTLKLETGYDIAASGVSYLPSSRTAWVGSGLEWDTRDHRANPSRGLFAAIGTRVGSRTRDSVPAQTLARSNLDLAVTLPLISPVNLTLAGHGRDVSATDTTYAYDLWELGGSASLRGFREGELLFTRGGWLNCELRYRAGPDSRIYPFFDLALVGQPGGWQWYSGYGLGLRIGTRIGLFGLDYGVRTGTSPLRGKIHFSVETGF